MGKTSLSEYLRREFGRRGIECKTVYLGGWHTFEYATHPISMALMLIGVDQHDDRVRCVLSRVLPWVFLVQYVFYFVYKMRGILFSKHKPSLCIVDRYIVDCLVELSILTENTDVSKTAVGSHLLHFPRPELSFYLDINEEVVFERKQDERHELSALRRRRRLYKSFAHQLGIITVNTSTMSLPRIKNRLLHIIEEDLNKNAGEKK